MKNWWWQGRGPKDYTTHHPRGFCSWDAGGGGFSWDHFNPLNTQTGFSDVDVLAASVSTQILANPIKGKEGKAV